MGTKRGPRVKPVKQHRESGTGPGGVAGKRLADNWLKLSDAEKKKFSKRTQELAKQSVDLRKKVT